MAIALITGPQDVSQLDSVLNGLIVQINSGFSGATPGAAPSAGSTSVAITGYGTVTVNTTTRAAGTTGRYSLAAPVAGRNLAIKNMSTSAATITGVFERSKIKLTLAKSTAVLATAKLPGVMLRGLSTSAWAIVASYGPVTVSS